MAGKHINRKKREVSAEDEWAHITGVGEKIEVADAMEVQDRSITFKNQYGEPSTNFEVYEEEKNKMNDEVGNTAQYLKFVNESIMEKKRRLDMFHERQRKFQEEIDSLQFYQPKTKEQLDKIKYKDIKAGDIEAAIKFLENEREEIKRKMEYFTSQVSRTQSDLIEKDKQIAEIKAELVLAQKKESMQSEQKQEDPIEVIKKQLESLENKEEARKILQSVNSLVERMNVRNN
ncbi:MAG: hypothetical protein DWQ18_07090 [Crenarchaeota archaeon]|nr:MAG: hypothetical protein DWQ17_02695 [Thermoproteota archaeon]RDJ32943.1 MAG: hypothetical protein DWQ18_07090 [Thermoproteota archaeon]RDJ35976.1 MAG: hypothetical protein DWQ13_08780 [Thermoproteota archaeon]RDJ38221.1 MAG: hypothetical protein DWQ19_00085 [Thermoproteota archaeon]